MARMLKRWQLGRGVLGTLVVIAIAGGAGYYLYQNLGDEGSAPSCKSDFNRCMKNCRRSSRDTKAAQTCQKGCEREQHLCTSLGR